MKIVTEKIDALHGNVNREFTDNLYNVGQAMLLCLQGDGDEAGSIPAIVVAINGHEDSPTTYDMIVYFKWQEGNYGGHYLIKDMCTWRYVQDGLPSLEIITCMIEDFPELEVHCLTERTPDTAKFCYF